MKAIINLEKVSSAYCNQAWVYMMLPGELELPEDEKNFFLVATVKIDMAYESEIEGNIKRASCVYEELGHKIIVIIGHSIEDSKAIPTIGIYADKIQKKEKGEV